MLRVSLWWVLERAAGRLWETHCRGERAVAGRPFVNWLCSVTYRRRKAAERRDLAGA